MAANHPMIIVDEVLLPGADTEVALDSTELDFLMARSNGDPEVGPVMLAFRMPSSAPMTRLESRRENPVDRVVAGCLLGIGTVIPPSDSEPHSTLTVESPTRVKLENAVSEKDGWIGSCSPWHLTDQNCGREAIDQLEDLFSRLLISTTDVEQANPSERFTRPLQTLADCDGDHARLWLMADFVFEDMQSRLTILLSDGSQAIHDILSETLSALSSELPDDDRLIRRPISSYVQRALGGSLNSLTEALPVLERCGPWLGDIAPELTELKGLIKQLEKTTERLLKKTAAKKHHR
jgi:hypothetical protein